MSLPRNDLPIERFQYEISNILVPYNINIFTHGCDAFEEIILKIAGIEEKPKGCRFQKSPAEDCFLILYTISPESVEKLISTLNTRFPSLEASEYTEQAESMQLEAKHNDQPGRFVKLNMNAVCKHLLPEIADYLRANPEVVAQYAKNTIESSRLKIMDEAFAENLDIHQAGLFGQTLWILVMKQTLIREALSENIPINPSLINIMMNYIFVDVELKVNPKNSTIKILSTLREENKNDSFSTDFHFSKVEPKSEQESTVKSIAKLLNVIAPVEVRKEVEAQSDPGDSKESVQPKEHFVVTGPNNLWIHPQFVSALHDVQKNFSQAELEAYGKEVGNKAKHIVKLKKIYEQLQTDPEFKSNESVPALLTALDDYINFVEQHRINENSADALQKQAEKVNEALEKFAKERKIEADELSFFGGGSDTDTSDTDTDNDQEIETTDADSDNEAESEISKIKKAINQMKENPAFLICSAVNKLLYEIDSIANHDAVQRALDSIHAQTWSRPVANPLLGP